MRETSANVLAASDEIRSSAVLPSPASQAEFPATNLAFAITLTVLFAAAVIPLCLVHAPWSDEADAWLAARDLGMRGLFHWLGTAGTPALWYLLLMPLAKAGLGVRAMYLLHAAIAISGAALLAFFAPLSRFLKTLILFSYPIAYEYAVVARSYVILVVLLWLVAIVLTHRRPRFVLLGVLLFLMANDNVHGLFIAAIIGAAVLARSLANRTYTRGMMTGAMIAMAGGALAFAQMLPSLHADCTGGVRRWPTIGYALSEGFLPHITHYTWPEVHAGGQWHASIALAYGVTRLAGLASVLAGFWLMRRSALALTIVAAAFGAMFYVFIFRWYGGEHHAGLLLVVLIFGIWVARSARPDSIAGPPGTGRLRSNARLDRLAAGRLDRLAAGLLCLGLCVSAGVFATYAVHEFRGEYSGGRDMALYIRAHGLENIPLAAGAGSTAETLLPFLPGERIWYSGRQEYGTFVRWDRDWRSDKTLSESTVLSRVEQRFGVAPHLLVIPEHPLSAPAQAGYRELHHTSAEIFGRHDERFFLYERVQPDANFRGPDSDRHEATH